MFRTRFRGFWFALASLLAITSVTSAQAQSSSKLKLAHAAPEDCIFFFTWNGWTESDPASPNRTEALFAEKSVKAFGTQLIAEVNTLITAAAAAQGNEQASIAAQVGPALAKVAMTHPSAIYLKSFRPADNPELEFAIVIDAEGEGTEAVASFQKLLSLIPKDGPKGAIEEKLGDATFIRPREFGKNEPEVRIGHRGSQLILAVGQQTPKELLDRLQKGGTPAAWVTTVTQELVVERPSMLMYFNAQKLLATLQPVITDPMAAAVMDALGITKVKSFAAVTGLDKTGMHSLSALTTDGTPTGIFDLIPDKPLSIGDFQKVPGSAVNATVARFDLAHVYDRLMTGLGQVNPQAKAQAEQMLAQIEPQLGFSLKGDLLEGLGDTWSYYTASGDAGVMFVPGIVVTASIRKPDGVAKALNVVVAAARAALANSGPQAPFTIQEFTAGSEKGYRIVIKNLPPLVQIQPTWVLTKDQLVIGLMPQLVTAHLAATQKSSLADNEFVKAAFQWSPKALTVSYSDPKPGLKSAYTMLNLYSPMIAAQLAAQKIPFKLPPLPPIGDIEKHLQPTVSTMHRTANGWRTESHSVIPSGAAVGPAAVGVGVALLLPAVQQAREAARRSQSKNNLKQIGLAMHNFHDAYRNFPAAASADKNGKKLLSWRVHILPFVDQAPLYQQFKLDEPWDSDHNKTLIAQIPPVYIQPTQADLAKEGKTVYLLPTGEGTMFDGKEGLAINKVTDGTSNTILAVEAHRDAAVIWTKPDDLEVDFKNPLKNLKSAMVGGFHTLFADGSVRFISDAIDVNILKALFTRAGGEVVNADAFNAPAPVAAVGFAPARVAAPAQGDAKNNLKQLGLAFHNYADKHKRLPQRAASDKKGKALLSWRVHLLPYLDANDLYQQFKLDEPWDSDNNKPLVEKMPAIFTSTGDEELAKLGKTRFVSPANAEGMLGIKEGTSFRAVRDGLSNTILAVEVRSDSAVIWTKPEDVVIDFKKPFFYLKDARKGGFLVLLGDGSVRQVANEVKAGIIKALVTREGGEVMEQF